MPRLYDFHKKKSSLTKQKENNPETIMFLGCLFSLICVHIGLVHVLRKRDLTGAELTTNLDLVSCKDKNPIFLHNEVSNKLTAFPAGVVIKPVEGLIECNKLDFAVKLIQELRKGQTLDLSGGELGNLSGFEELEDFILV